MKAKVLLLLGFGILGFSHYEASASNENEKESPYYYQECMMPNGAEKIELHGCLMFNIGANSIEAYSYNNEIFIHFNQSFGNVSISLYNAIGNLIYNCVVDTSTQQLVVIPINNVASGTYTVVLDNANGYVEGDFEHD